MIINNYFFCIEILFHDYETRKSNTSSIGHHDTTIVNLVFRSYNNFIKPESIHTVASVKNATTGFIYKSYKKKGLAINRNHM